MDKHNKNELTKDSNYTLTNNKFENNRDIHIGDKIHQEINDNSVSYELEISDVNNIESLSKYLTGKFGDTNVGIIGIISLISGTITIFSSLNSFFGITAFKIIPLFSQRIGGILFAFGFIFLLLGSILLNALRYKQETKCRECGTDYAYRDYKNPLVREVEAHEGVRKNITRFLECKNCGDNIEKKYSKLIPYESEED